jgi:CRISPR/Cas system-associated endonuclease Cas1
VLTVCCLPKFNIVVAEDKSLADSICVGLEPAIGFFHRPRSAAHPLALNIMELFRTTV